MPNCTSISRTMRRWLACSAAALLVLAGMAAPAAAQSDEMKPIAVISATNYTELLSDVDFLGQFGGQVKAGQQADSMLMLFTQQQGLQGLDKSKPWGAVVLTDGFQFVPVVCLPVTDYDKLLALPTMFQMGVSDVGDGISEIEIPNQSIYVKKSGNWAFLAQAPEMLESTPADPAKLFNSLAKDYDLGVRVMVQNVPEMYRSIAIEQIRAGAQQGLQQMPNETDEAFEARSKMTEANIEQLVKLVNELDELEIGFNTEPEAGNVTLDFTCSGIAGSDLGNQIASYTPVGTKFSGCIKEGAAIQFNLTSETPSDVLDSQRDAMMGQLSSLRQQIMNAIDQEVDLPNEEARDTVKEAIGDLMDSLEATALTGKLDMAGYFDVSDDSLSMVAGGYAKETSKIESALKKLAALVEGDPNFPGINWNADSHAGCTIHSLSIPVPADEEDAREMLGESLDVALALGDDTFYLAAGANSMSNMKAAMDASGGSSDVVKPMKISVALTPLVRLGLKAEPDATGEAMLDALTTKSEGEDQIHVTVDMVDGKARYRLELEKGVLHAFGAAAMEARRQGAAAGF
ncbi:hypothetical protein [Aeoliella mucimassa]|uniref:Uncharacterized protein n=1 Tax=Aeoliella mucimassa TaxID=2527972 RepID=A0A518AJJ8_9BACT|nr:hypothetical protein [Aeoliella mucimassa]QDU54856.1 hypothetical protein Pan181_10400 [Aeoliella mucimassa]